MQAAMFVLAAGLAFPSAGTRADDLPKGWTFTGQTQAVADDVRARVTGHLTRLAVREGDAVKKGDLLAEIDPRAYRLDLDAVKARQKVAEAKLQAAKLKTDNAKILVLKKVVGKGDLALNAAAESEAEAALQGAKVEVERAGLTLDFIGNKGFGSSSARKSTEETATRNQQNLIPDNVYCRGRGSRPHSVAG